MIPDGAVLNYAGTWPAGNLFGFSDYTGKVYGDLATAGLAVRTSTSNAQTATLLGTTIKVQLQLQVQNGLGFDNPDDVISIINHAVYQATGSFPLSGTIPTVQSAPDSKPVSTGQPGVPVANTGEHQCGDPSWGITDDFPKWVECLTTKGLTTLGLVAIGLAIGIAFILFAEHEA